MPRFIVPFTVVEEVGDLYYRLILPRFYEDAPVFYVGRLKRYVDLNEVTYVFDIANERTPGLHKRDFISLIVATKPSMLKKSIEIKSPSA